MTINYNIYCDESCHLENDKQRFMVLGGLSIPEDLKHDVFQRVKNIRMNHSIKKSEMKWTKVSSSYIDAYEDLINYFFDKDDIIFRCVIIDKKELNHIAYNQSHDEFYYKMYFYLLNWFISPDKICNIYLDIKDTNGSKKIKTLYNCLCNSNYDFSNNMISNIQEIRSHEVVLMQIVDVLIGAVGYANRFPNNSGVSSAKKRIVDLIIQRSKCTLTKSTPHGSEKFNVFHWKGAE
jgi:hypothetical protein